MKDFSLQLYSLRDIPDLRKRMEVAAEAGYTGVEFAGYGGIPAPEMKKLLTSLGLRGAGSHIAIELLTDDLDGCIDYCLQAGITSAACPYADMKTREDVLKLAPILENCARRFGEAGIPFAYHNHHQEFVQDGGQYLLETLMEETESLEFELDVFWASYAGVDPVAFIEKHAGRITLLHFKEMDAERRNVELGRGIVDFATIARTAAGQGLREIIVEQEQYTLPPAESVVVDAQYMKQFTY